MNRWESSEEVEFSDGEGLFMKDSNTPPPPVSGGSGGRGGGERIGPFGK